MSTWIKVGSSILPSSILSYYHGTTLFVYIYLSYLKLTYPLKLDGVRRQSFPFGFASWQVRTVSCGGGYLFQTYIYIYIYIYVYLLILLVAVHFSSMCPISPGRRCKALPNPRLSQWDRRRRRHWSRLGPFTPWWCDEGTTSVQPKWRWKSPLAQWNMNSVCLFVCLPIVMVGW